MMLRQKPKSSFGIFGRSPGRIHTSKEKEGAITNGFLPDIGWVIMEGPFKLRPRIGYYELDYFGDDKWQENLLAWGVDELFLFHVQLTEGVVDILIAPDVGVLFYSNTILLFMKLKKTVYTLQRYEHQGIDMIDSSVEDISFGKVKKLLQPPRSDGK